MTKVCLVCKHYTLLRKQCVAHYNAVVYNAPELSCTKWQSKGEDDAD